jgi:hypothetical protein
MRVLALLLAASACMAVPPDAPKGFRLLGDQDSRRGDIGSRKCRVSHYYCANSC